VSVDRGSAKQSLETTACSWCQKSFREVGPLVEGPGTGKGSVYICAACAELCLSIFDIESRRREEKFPDGGDGGASCNATGEARPLPPEP
jgi:ClpX C4-type zinc finger